MRINVSIIIIFTIFFISTCYTNYIMTYYEIKDIPRVSSDNNIWNLNDEIMYLHDPDSIYNRKKERNATIFDKYYIGNALFSAKLYSRDISAMYPRDPFSIELMVWGLRDYHVSFTIKNITVITSSGNDFSYLVSKNLPIVILFKDSDFQYLFPSIYRIEESIFFNGESVIIEFELEINTINDSEIGNIVFEFEPVKTSIKWKWGTR